MNRIARILFLAKKLSNWVFPLEISVDIPNQNEIGAWGSQRDKDKHRGIDLYAPEGTKVIAVENGIVSDIFNVPPPEDAPSGKETQAIAIDGPSGRATYAEIKANPNIKVGDKITQGQSIGAVTKIHDEESDIPNSMLHFQLSSGGPVDEWIKEKPKNLLNPTDMLQRSKTASDYMGEHSAPTNDGYNEPIHDIKDIYPDLYTRGGSEYVVMSEDREGLSIILKVHNKPNSSVKVYRAVPDLNKETNEKINHMYNAVISLEAKLNHRAVKTTQEAKNLIYDLMDKYPIEKHTYEEQQKKMIEDIRNQIEELELSKKKPIKIEKGNWVTPSKNYAKMHGIGALNGKYKIISKTVKAKDLYTDGNSLSEWGYDPQ
jgi:polyhydroxyalkanoate synthesis regulator phasin